jgi:hypothetical protein
VIAQPPIQFDRATGVLEGVNAWERSAALALVAGSKASSNFAYRGCNGCASLLRRALDSLAIVDRIKVATNVGYNVFGMSSAFWQDRINRLNADAPRRVQ